MRTRPYCFALLLPCIGVRIAQAYRRNGPTMFVAGGVCVPDMFLYVGTVYHAVQATIQQTEQVLFFGFPGKRIAKRAWSARCLPPSGVHVWLFSLALPFPVRLPEKREKITPVLWDRFIYLLYLFIYHLFWTQACPEGMCTKGTRWSHAKCHPYPIPQPVKVDHTTVQAFVHYAFASPLKCSTLMLHFSH